MKSKFESLSDQELKQYFLEHRDDESFHAYMDRKAQRPKRVLLAENEANLPFDERIKLIQERMRSGQGTAQIEQ